MAHDNEQAWEGIKGSASRLMLCDYCMCLYAFVLGATEATEYFAASVYVGALAACLALPGVVLRFRQMPKELALAVLFIVWCLFTSYFHLSSGSSAEFGSLSMVRIFGFFIVIIVCSNSFRRSIAVLGCFFVGGLYSVLGLFLFTSHFGDDLTREMGVGREPNAVGFFVALFACVGLVLVPLVKRRVWKLAILALIVMAIVGVAKTGSRGSMITVAMAIAIYGGLEWLPRLARPKVADILILLTALSVGTFLVVFVLPKTGAGQRLMETSSDFSADSRVYLARDAWSLFKKSPVLGRGQAGYTDFSGAIYSHNGYLDLLCMHGFPAFLLVMGIYVAISLRIFALRSRFRHCIEARMMFSGILATIACIAFNAMFLPTITSKLATLVCGVFIGFSSSLRYEASSQ